MSEIECPSCTCYTLDCGCSCECKCICEEKLYNPVLSLIDQMIKEDFEIHGYGNCCSNTLESLKKSLKERWDLND